MPPVLLLLLHELTGGASWHARGPELEALGSLRRDNIRTDFVKDIAQSRVLAPELPVFLLESVHLVLQFVDALTRLLGVMPCVRDGLFQVIDDRFVDLVHCLPDVVDLAGLGLFLSLVHFCLVTALLRPPSDDSTESAAQ